jgi:hypothetical protein
MDQREELQTNAAPETLWPPASNVSFEDSDPLPKTLPEVHHHISNTTRLKENIFRWVDFHEQAGDLAIKVIWAVTDMISESYSTSLFLTGFHS